MSEIVDSVESRHGEIEGMVGKCVCNREIISRLLIASRKEILDMIFPLLTSFLSIRRPKSEFEAVCGVCTIWNEIEVEIGEKGIIIGNAKERKLLRVNEESLSEIEHMQVLDLSDEGERWEGDVSNSQPYGWGVLFNKDGEKVYEGFRIGGANVCYGRSYYPDVGVIEYEGEICGGKRWGRGVQYDKRGEVVYDGEWMNDDRLIEEVTLNSENEKSLVFPNRVKVLRVSHHCCNRKNWRVLDLRLLSSLRELIVGDGCFQNTKEVKLIGMSQLERVEIGKSTCCDSSTSYGCDPTRCFYLRSCPRMKELKIGCSSFNTFSVCRIENMSSLEGIVIGDLDYWSYNFVYADLELRSCFCEERVRSRFTEIEVDYYWKTILSRIPSCRI